jgi:hypothetical protein
LKPNITSFVSEEFIPEQKLETACSLLTRLFEVADEEKILKITSNNITELINHSSDDNWKYKYIAYIAIAEIAGYIKELSDIKPLLSMIIKDLFNVNVKVKYASLYCIADLSDEHNPDFQNDYHQEIVPKFIQLLNESKCLSVQLEICDSFNMFVEHMTDNDASKYLQTSLDVLFSIFIKSEKKVYWM